MGGGHPVFKHENEWRIDIILCSTYPLKVMSRITINIEDSLLKAVKSLQQQENKPISMIFSQLLSEALAHRKQLNETPKLNWISQPMHPRIDLGDKDTIYASFDRDES